jgi:hypothetical protein
MKTYGAWRYGSTRLDVGTIVAGEWSALPPGLPPPTPPPRDRRHWGGGGRHNGSELCGEEIEANRVEVTSCVLTASIRGSMLKAEVLDWPQSVVTRCDWRDELRGVQTTRWASSTRLERGRTRSDNEQGCGRKWSRTGLLQGNEVHVWSGHRLLAPKRRVKSPTIQKS